MIREGLPHKVRAAILRHKLILPGETVVAGISGGADSIALLHLLHEMARRGDPPFAMHVAHLNHGLRGREADADERFVVAEADRLKLSVTVERVDVAALRRQEGLSTEEAGRKARYAFFRNLAVRLGAAKIAVAHTLDDQAETILHRIVRGTGLRGLRGMLPIRRLTAQDEIFVIRPLLDVPKAKILEYLAGMRLSHREDATNRSATFVRNRIRMKILPVLERQFNPEIRKTLVRLGHTAAHAYRFLRQSADESYAGVAAAQKLEGAHLRIPQLLDLPRALQPLVIDRAVLSVNRNHSQLTFDNYHDILLLAERHGGAKELHLPSGLVVRREADTLAFIQRPTESGPIRFVPVSLQVPGVTKIEGFNLSVECEVLPAEGFDLHAFFEQKGVAEEVLDLDRIRPPVVMRQRAPGDVFTPLGTTGHQKLKKFLMNAKVPRALRDRVPILCDQERVIWVVGFRLDDGVKITGRTRRILRLRVTETAEG